MARPEGPAFPAFPAFQGIGIPGMPGFLGMSSYVSGILRHQRETFHHKKQKVDQ